MRRVGDHPIADGETRGLARVEDFAHVTVAERNRLGELAADGGERREEAFGPDLGEDGAEFLGLLPGLAQPAGATELDEHALRAERDQRTRGADEQAAAARAGRGRVDESGATRTQMLDKLAQVQERARSCSKEDCSVKVVIAASTKPAVNISGVNQMSRSTVAWRPRRMSPSASG